MTTSLTEPYTGYLEVKRPVDERAINERVWRAVVGFLRCRGDRRRPLRVLEVGAGLGDTAQRLLAEETAPALEYTLVDLQPEHVDAARRRLLRWAQETEFSVTEAGGSLVLKREDHVIRLVAKAADLFDFVRQARSGAGWDLVIAQSLLDLFDLPEALPRLFSVLSGGGAYYFPITFDGLTRFLPVVDPDLDARIERLYHASMDDRAEGGSRAGSHLLTTIPAAGAAIREVGSSDWVVFPRESGHYPEGERAFLGHLLGFVQQELKGHPELDPDAFQQWMHTRRHQLQERELSCIVHQLDFFGVVQD